MGTLFFTAIVLEFIETTHNVISHLLGICLVETDQNIQNSQCCSLVFFHGEMLDCLHMNAAFPLIKECQAESGLWFELSVSYSNNWLMHRSSEGPSHSWMEKYDLLYLQG